MTGLLRRSPWERSVRPHFDFLLDEFGFEYRGVDESIPLLTRVSYMSRMTEVDVDDSEEFERVEVQLVRLVDGARPPYPTFTSNTPVLHHFSLDAVLATRARDELALIQPVASYKGGNVDRALRAWADALRAHANDILRGDFSLFPELEAALRETVRQNPESVEVWVPSGTDLAPADIRQLSETFPSIAMVVSKYRRRPRSLPALREFIRRVLRGR